MPLPSPLAQALEWLRHGRAAGRLSHAYLVVGAPRGRALELAQALAQLVFCPHADPPCGECPACRRVRERTHPDVAWIEPQKKSREIDVEQIRALTQQIALTSYGGGWKAAVVLFADCLNENAANALLKTLEEPPPQTLLVLVTDAPQFLPATLRSRCQYLALPPEEPPLRDDWRAAVMDRLRRGRAPQPLEALIAAAGMAALLKDVKTALEKEFAGSEPPRTEDARRDHEVWEARVRARSLEVREQIFELMLWWHRDLLLAVLGLPDALLHFRDDAPVLRQQAAQLDYPRALEQLADVEAMRRRLELNVPELAVLEAGQLAALS